MNTTAVKTSAAATKPAKKTAPAKAPVKKSTTPAKSKPAKAPAKAPIKKATTPAKSKPAKKEAAPTKKAIAHPKRVTKQSQVHALINREIEKAGGVSGLDRAEILPKLVEKCGMTDKKMASTYYHNDLRART